MLPFDEKEFIKMNDPVFVIPSDSPISYSDYYRLIELSGLETCPQDKVDYARKCSYIYTFHNMIGVPETRDGKSVLWFLERPASCGGPANFTPYIEKFMTERHVDEIWFSDRTMHQLFNRVNSKFLPLGTDIRLGKEPLDQKDFDCAHMAYIAWGTRREFLWRLSCRVTPNSWGAQRDELLQRTKFMFNVHQDNDQYFEPLRFSVAAAFALPIISETCVDAYPFESGIDYIPLSYQDLQGYIQNVIYEDYARWKEMGLRCREKISKNFNFKDNVKRLIGV